MTVLKTCVKARLLEVRYPISKLGLTGVSKFLLLLCVLSVIFHHFEGPDLRTCNERFREGKKEKKKYPLTFEPATS